MENKSALIVSILIEKLKNDTHFFGELGVVETHGTYGSKAEITMQNGDDKDVYSIIVVKHAPC